jgi:hypothetical protein
MPDARDISAELAVAGVRLSLGGSVHDPIDPASRLLFKALTMVAVFESDLIRAQTRQATVIAREEGRLRGRSPELSFPTPEKDLVELHGAGTHSSAELAELFTVGRATASMRWGRVRARWHLDQWARTITRPSASASTCTGSYQTSQVRWSFHAVRERLTFVGVERNIAAFVRDVVPAVLQRVNRTLHIGFRLPVPDRAPVCRESPSLQGSTRRAAYPNERDPVRPQKEFPCDEAATRLFIVIVIHEYPSAQFRVFAKWIRHDPIQTQWPVSAAATFLVRRSRYQQRRSGHTQLVS